MKSNVPKSIESFLKDIDMYNDDNNDKEFDITLNIDFIVSDYDEVDAMNHENVSEESETDIEFE